MKAIFDSHGTIFVGETEEVAIQDAINQIYTEEEASSSAVKYRNHLLVSRSMADLLTDIENNFKKRADKQAILDMIAFKLTAHEWNWAINNALVNKTARKAS